MSDARAKDIRYYTPGQVLLACLIGSPIAGGWLMARTFRWAGDRKKEKATLIICITVTAAAISLGFFLPVKGSGTPIAGAIAGMMFQSAKKYLGPAIEERAGDGTKGSWWAAAGVGLLCLISILAILVGIVVAFRK
jgi:hypothetical protein